jgi:hypothetical protein
LNSPFSPKRLPPVEEISVFSPNGPWATVEGLCDFDKVDVREFSGDEVEIGTASNPEPVPVLVPEVVGEYKTQGLKWNLRYRVRDLTRHEVVQMFVEAGANMDDWALEQMTVQITGPAVEIPPCTDVTMRFRPSFRSVSLRPVFLVSRFGMDYQPYLSKWFIDVVARFRPSWRDWGDEWSSIFLHNTR